jgi:signal peptidase I
MNPKTSNPCWKGLLASLILAGSGQYFQGRREKAAFAFLTLYGLLPLSLLVLFVPFVPPMLALLLLPVGWIATLYFLIDSWRPTPPIGWRGWAIIVVIAVAGYYGEKLSAFSICRVYSIPTDSMSPTIRKGDHVFCQLPAYGSISPPRGEIVVFPHEETSGQNALFEKRLIGLPGDILKIKDGVLTVNGTPYNYPGQSANYTAAMPDYPGATLLEGEAFTVPKGQIYVLGDNSSRSLDSRYWGPIPLSSVKGKITVILWPIIRVHRISD